MTNADFAAKFPKLAASLITGCVKFNGIRFIQRTAADSWVLLGFEGEEESIEGVLTVDRDVAEVAHVLEHRLEWSSLDFAGIMGRIADRRNQPNPVGAAEDIEAELAAAPKTVRSAIAAGDEVIALEDESAGRGFRSLR